MEFVANLHKHLDFDKNGKTVGESKNIQEDFEAV